MAVVRIKVPAKTANRLVAAGLAGLGLVGSNAISGYYAKMFADGRCERTHEAGKPPYEKSVALTHQYVKQKKFESFLPSPSLEPNLPEYVTIPLKVLAFPIEVAMALTYPVHSGIGDGIGIRMHNREHHPSQNGSREIITGVRYNERNV